MNWTINFAKTLCNIMGVTHELTDKRVEELEAYFDTALKEIDMNKFVE